MSTANAAVPPGPRDFFGHPVGLFTLFFTELWERFSYYGMRAFLILYMTAAVASGGLGWDTERAAHVYGLYTSGVYFMSIPGGWLADRLLGLRRSVFLGGIGITLGHLSLAMGSMTSFYAGLVLIVLGTGLLKPNVSALVGELYAPGDTRRDAGFSIYYMGINIGAVTAPILCGYLAEKVGWHWGFGAAAVGMIAGLVFYVLGGKLMGQAGLTVKPKAPTAEERAALGDSGEGKRIAVIFILFLFSALFWAGFEQHGSSFNLFARDFTDRSVFGHEFPTSWFQSVNGLMIIAFAPVFAWLWMRLGSREPSSPAKFAVALVCAGAGFIIMVGAALASGADGARVSPWWLVGAYFMHTVGELCLSPVGLSTVTKLAPGRLVGLMMGVWFLSLSLGNYVAGQIAGYFEKMPLPQLFGTVAVVLIGAGIVLALLVAPIRKLMGNVR